MPLLGRNKADSPKPKPEIQQSQPLQPHHHNQEQQLQQQAQVCESPLFGVRRQLPSSRSPEQPEVGELAQEKLLGSVPQQISPQQIHYAFNMMDTNGDGMIDVRDLSQMLANLGVPIDEAILSHIMSSVSKRTTGNQRINESQFLAWLANFIQVSDSAPARHAHSAGHSLSLSAQQSAGSTLRQRRGSGSGLALMRSLSASEASPATPPAESPASASADSEARSDLKAAFCVFDLDGDGFITLDEVRSGLRLLGESWSTAELVHLFGGSAAGPELQRINIDDFVRLLL